MPYQINFHWYGKFRHAGQADTQICWKGEDAGRGREDSAFSLGAGPRPLSSFPDIHPAPCAAAKVLKSSLDIDDPIGGLLTPSAFNSPSWGTWSILSGAKPRPFFNSLSNMPLSHIWRTFMPGSCSFWSVPSHIM